MIIKLWKHLTRRRRRQFFLLLILMVVASIMEIISISAVVPFLGALTSPEQIYQHHLAQPLIQTLGLTDSSQLLLPLTIIFVMATLIAAAVRLLLLYASTKLSYATGADLSIDIYRRTLYQDYSIHMSRNSSEIVNSIITKTNIVIGSILVPLLTLIGSIVIMIGVIGVIFTVNTQIAVITFFTFSLIYWIITFFTRKSLQKNSQVIADQSTQMVKSLQEGLGGIRDVLIDGTQEFYCKLYQNSDLSMRRAAGSNIFIGSSPRYLMEAIGMILIAVLAYALTLQEDGVMKAIPILGVLAIGAQKLLPALQQVYNSYSTVKGAKSSFVDVLNLLNQPLPHNAGQSLINLMPFEQEIIFKNLSFRYAKNTPWILKNVNLTFKKGETIGFIGETGSGKSTLLDILMGLLVPTSGELLIDGVSISQLNRDPWQMNISHVPQSIYLSDSTIRANIAFGVDPEQIKEEKVAQVAQQAQIAEVINNLKNKYKAFVGERGSQLSGGQRQRIGIARALYKDSDVLIFDEATSALDNKTEEKIMQQISQLENNKTIFIIAHKLETLKQCDRIIRINTDYTIEQMNYNQIEIQ
jgi:ATP-binding cassette, subfamily B, bacterial PglK